MQLQNCICKMAHSVVQNDIKTFYKVRKKVHVLSDIIVGHEKYKLNYQKKNYQKKWHLSASVCPPARCWICLQPSDIIYWKNVFLHFFQSFFLLVHFYFLSCEKKDCGLWSCLNSIPARSRASGLELSISDVIYLLLWQQWMCELLCSSLKPNTDLLHWPSSVVLNRQHFNLWRRHVTYSMSAQRFHWFTLWNIQLNYDLDLLGFWSHDVVS